MNRPDEPLFTIQDLAIQFSLINRNHYLAGNNKHENDSEHTIAVALLCWYIHDAYKINLDISKILKYAIAHDLVEIYAGDVNTFATQAERAKKVEAEKDSMNRLKQELSSFPDLIYIMQEYEAKQSEEALFVWTVDKMQPLIMGDMDNWRPYHELGITYEEFCQKYEALLRDCSPHAKEIFEGLVEYSKTTYIKG